MSKRSREMIKEAEAIDQRILVLPKQPSGLYNSLLASVPGGDTLYKLTFQFSVNNISTFSTTVPINDPGFTQSRDGRTHKAMLFLQNFTTSKAHQANVNVLEVRVGVPSYQHTVVDTVINTNFVSATTHTCPGVIAIYGKQGTGATNFTSVSNIRNTSFYPPQYLLTSWPFNQMEICLQDGETDDLAVFNNSNAGVIIFEFAVVLMD